MLPQLPPAPTAFQRFFNRWRPLSRTPNHPTPWHALEGVGLKQAHASAWKLARAGVEPPAQFPLPMPKVWLNRVFEPALPVGSPELNLPRFMEDPELTAQDRPECASWLPWGWAWNHHREGLTALRQGMLHIIRAGDVPWFQTLAHCWPTTPEGQAVWHELAPLIWSRPLHLRQEHWVGRGDWRHTLAMWRLWVEKNQSNPAQPCVVPTQGRPFVGTSASRWRWRLHHFQAWQELGLPPPLFEVAVQLAGWAQDVDNGWGRWCEEGFASPSDEGHLETDRANQRVWDFLGQWLGVSQACRSAAFTQWLASSRGMDRSTQPRSAQWQELEKHWLERLCPSRETIAPWGAWLHLIAGNPGVTRVGLEVLNLVPWPPHAFAEIQDGKLPWQRCQAMLRAHGEWPAKDRMEATRVVSWLRAHSRMEDLEASLPGVNDQGRKARL